MDFYNKATKKGIRIRTANIIAKRRIIRKS